MHSDVTLVYHTTSLEVTVKNTDVLESGFIPDFHILLRFLDFDVSLKGHCELISVCSRRR